MTNIRKSIGGAILGLALAGALGFGVTEIYASAVSTDAVSSCPLEKQAASSCPVEKQASASCPLDEAADCPKSAHSCPSAAKGA